MMYSQQYLNRRRAWVSYWMYKAALEDILSAVQIRYGSGAAVQVKEHLLKPYLDSVESLWLWSTNRFSSVLSVMPHRPEDSPLREPGDPGATTEIVTACQSRLRARDMNLLGWIREGLEAWISISRVEREEPAPLSDYSITRETILRGCVKIAGLLGVCPEDDPVAWGATGPRNLNLSSGAKQAVLALTHLLGRPIDREQIHGGVRVLLDVLSQFTNMIDYQLRIEDFNTPDAWNNDDYRAAILAVWEAIDQQAKLVSLGGLVFRSIDALRQLQMSAVNAGARIPDPDVSFNRCFLPERTLLGTDIGSARSRMSAYVRRMSVLSRLARELSWLHETQVVVPLAASMSIHSSTHSVLADLESIIEESIDGNMHRANLDGRVRVRDHYYDDRFRYPTLPLRTDETGTRDHKTRVLINQFSMHLTNLRDAALRGGTDMCSRDQVCISIQKMIAPVLELESILRSEAEQTDQTYITAYARMLYGLYLESDYDTSEIHQLVDLIREGLAPTPPPEPPTPIRLEDPTDRPEPAISGDGIQSAARLYEWLVTKHHLTVRNTRDVWSAVAGTPNATEAARAVGYGRFVCATHHHIHCPVCHCPVCGAPGGCNCQGRRVRRYSEGPPVIAARRDARRVGVELEVETSSIEALQTLLAEYPYCHSDSTLTEYGAEVKIIGYSDRLHTLGRLVTRIFRSKDIHTKPNCGFHVHVERRTFDSLNDIHARWLAIEPEVFNLFPSRARNEFCKSLRISDISDHHSVLSMSRHGTWEFRVHPGTVSWVVAACWADWCVGFIEGRKADLGAAYWDARKATRALLNTLNPPQTPPPPPPVQIPTERSGEDPVPPDLVPLMRDQPMSPRGGWGRPEHPRFIMIPNSGSIALTYGDQPRHVDETLTNSPTPVPPIEALPIIEAVPSVEYVEFPQPDDLNHYINRALRAARPRFVNNTETGRVRAPRLANRPQDMEARGKIEKSTHPWAWRLAVHQVNQRVQQKQVIKAIQDGVFREFEDEKRVLEAKDKVLAMHAEAQQVLRQ